MSDWILYHVWGIRGYNVAHCERIERERLVVTIRLASDGAVHLLYCSGEDHTGDVHYARRDTDERSFSDPVQVNSQSGNVIAVNRRVKTSHREARQLTRDWLVPTRLHVAGLTRPMT